MVESEHKTVSERVCFDQLNVWILFEDWIHVQMAGDSIMSTWPAARAFA